MVRTGASAMTPLTFGMSPDIAHVDGCCDDRAVDELVRDFHPVEDPRGIVTRRAALLLALSSGERDQMPLTGVAVDLAESWGARERSAGQRVRAGPER